MKPSLTSSRPAAPSLRLTAAVALLAASLAGCGGGGGSKPAPRGAGTVAMFTDLSGLSAARRVRYSVSEFDGLNDKRLLVTKTSNASSGQVRTDLSGLPAGTLHLRGEVLGASGETLAELDTLVQGETATAFEATASQAVSAVSVAPAAAQVRKGKARRFFATARTAENRLVFAPIGAFTWTTSAISVAAVEAGRVTGVGAGEASVTATHGASGVSGSALATVTAAARSKWTVLVYLNAANDLAPFSTLNVNQMERAAGNPEVRTVVQWKTSTTFDANAPFSGTRRYQMRENATSALASTLVEDLGQGVDMGSPETLREFIAWGKANYPSDRTVLVVWNHGNGWRRGREGATRAVSYDDELGTSIQAWQLDDALGSERFDVFAWDASLMQMLEVAYELRAHADYVVGSEESPPGEGYPYDKILSAFRDDPDASTKDLTKSFVDAMLSEPAYATRKITQSVLDASKLESLAASLDAFAASLIENRSSLTTLVPKVRAEAQSYSPSLGRVYRDLFDVADRIGSEATAPAVSAAASALKGSIQAALVWEGHNAQSAGSRGVAIDFSSASTFTGVGADYDNLGLAARTRWDEWLEVAP